MSTTRPVLTVGVPVHDGARFLEATLRSILDQDVDGLEVLVSDNGSTDSTLEIARSFARSDPRVHVLHSPVNRGAAWNYNTLARTARGEFFRWASHDDLLLPGNLARCLEELRQGGPDVVLAYPRTTLIDGHGHVIEEYDDRVDARQVSPWERLRHLLRHLRLCNAVFGVTRRDVLLDTRMIGPFHSSDVVLLSELAMRGRIHEVPERLFLRRRLEEPTARVHLTPREKVQWFDPAQSPRHVMKRTRLVREHVRSIAAAPLTPYARARCLGVLGSEWGPRHWRTVGSEVRRAVQQSLGAGTG